MGLLANYIEALGVPTLVIGTVRDIMMEVRSPRAVFVDHPAGRTFGPPGDSARHVTVLEAALNELPRFTKAGQIRDLPCQWEADGNRSWETALREEVLRPPLGGTALQQIIRLQSSSR